jgi:predicted O-methyltransferase YrrM
MTFKKIWSKSKKRYYYYDADTNQSKWDRPDGYVSEEEPPATKRRREENPDVDNGARTEWSREGALSEYKPPESGAAADLVKMKGRNLPYPKIVSTLPPSSSSMWERTDIQVNPHLTSVYATGTITDHHGKPHKFKDCTNPIQGRHLYNLVKENKYHRTLEVGLAMAASAVWITQAQKENNIPNSLHIAIDPNQTSQYQNIGKLLVERAGLLKYLTVMEMTSYRAMPKLLEDIIVNNKPKFDLIYIDGWHTFDYTLVDFFYADLLLEVHGVIVLDDIMHTPVKKCLEYIRTNYPHYELVKKTPCYDPGNTTIKSSQATFIKLSEDGREWNAHINF